MDIEKIATSAIVTSLSKTDRLSGFINSGDKEPCWDGNIYIHEDKKHSKKNIKKVATQVKGKLVKAGTPKDTVKYPVSYDDLNAYMMNGGTLFFVVHIDSSNGDTIQIYYAELLPFKIKEILNTKKDNYQIVCREFPNDNLQKTELLLNFYNNAQRQTSFAGRELPTIEDLTKQGVLESLSFHYTSVGKMHSHFSLPQKMDGKSLTLYANVKGCSAPIPVQYCENIHQITMSSGTDDPVCVNGKEFYKGYTIVTTAENVELHIGSCVRLSAPNIDSPTETVAVSVKFKVKGTLKERIRGVELILAIKEHGVLSIAGNVFPVKFSDTDLSSIRAKEFQDLLVGYRKAQEFLDAMHVKKELDFDSCTDEDIEKLNLLIATVGDKKLTRQPPETEAQVQIVTIANLKFAVVYLKKADGGYAIWDYFGNRFAVEWRDGEKDAVRISQFSTMVADDFLNLDNLDLQMILYDYQHLEMYAGLHELANATMLEMLKAYDKQPSAELLEAAKEMCTWLASYSEFTSYEVVTINSLQITLRERPLTFEEKSQLHSIIATTGDVYYKIGALLLLDEQAEAAKLLETLKPEDAKKFMEFPIYQRFNKTTQ